MDDEHLPSPPLSSEMDDEQSYFQRDLSRSSVYESYDDQDRDHTDGLSIHSASSSSTIIDEPQVKVEPKTLSKHEENAEVESGPSTYVPESTIRSHATRVQGTERHPVVVTPIREMGQKGVWGQICIRYRLWRISSKVRGSRLRPGDLPSHYYADLIELQRYAPLLLLDSRC